MFRTDSTCPYVLRIQTACYGFRLRDFHTLWLDFPDHSTIHCFAWCLSLPLEILLFQVWPLPLSLAATHGISFDFSSSAYLDVSLRQVPFSRTIWFIRGSLILHQGGFPIRRSADQCLFTATRSLSQLVTSFVGSWCQGIHLMLFFAWTSPIQWMIYIHALFSQIIFFGCFYC